MTPPLTIALLLGALAFADPPTPDAPALYKDLAAKAGRGADAQVNLALWCEANGLDAERVKHLAVAVLTAPDHVRARALLGLVKEDGKWRRPEEVANEVRAEKPLTALLAEYNARRDAAPDVADSHWKLGLWCRQKGLKAEAKAHFTAVTRLDPGRDAAWKELGCKQYGKRWMTPEQVAAEKSRNAAEHKGYLQWVKWLNIRKNKLASDKLRASAELELAGLSDPLAASAVWAVFVSDREPDQHRAADLLGQLDGADAALALGALAVNSSFPTVRTRATEVLARRDAREAIGPLVEMVVTPLKFEVRFVNGPGQPGVLYVEGELFNIRKIYDAPLPRLSLHVVEPEVDFDTLPLLSTRMILRTTYQRPENKEADKKEHHQPVKEEHPGPQTQPGIQMHPGTQTHPGARVGHPGGAMTEGSALNGGFGPDYGPGTGPTGDLLMPRVTPGALGHATVPGHPRTLTPLPWNRQDDDRRDDEERRRRQDFERATAIERNWNQARLAAVTAAQALAADLAAVQGYNAAAGEVNARVMPVLQAVTGRPDGPDRQGWKAWWADQNGYAYNRPAKPTFEEHATNVYQPNFVAVPIVTRSCFAAGTPVKTMDGSRPIEALRIGDRVLTQDTKTGGLSYQPVLGIFHNRPAPTLKIDLSGEAIVATPIHRFWRAGKGWAMARDLKPGDLVRTVGGTVRVKGVQAEPVQAVFNLEVAEGHSFFVGATGALVHDNAPVRSQDHPFDFTPEIAAIRPARSS